jgi:UTP--glucose-1-phosphate uridylyltransferase
MIELATKQNFWGFEFFGKSFDCGSKLGFLAANLSYALARPELGPALRELLKSELAEASQPCREAAAADSPDGLALEPAE